MTLTEMQSQAREIRLAYNQKNMSEIGRVWTGEELMLGFVGDVGRLSQMIQAKEGIRQYPDAEEKLKHKLDDCLWSIMALADHYEVDLEQSFSELVDELKERIQ